MRFPISELDVTSFDAGRFIPKMEKTIASGIDLCTVSELKKVDADWKQKLHALECTIDADIPSPDPITSQPFTQYEKMLADPGLLHDGCVVAVDNGRLSAAYRLKLLWGKLSTTCPTSFRKNHVIKNNSAFAPIIHLSSGQKAGMKKVRQHDTYEKEIHPGKDLSKNS